MSVGSDLSKPVRPFDMPLGLARMDGARLAGVKAVGKLLKRHRARLRRVLVLGELAVDRLECAKLALHEAVTEVVLDALLAATPHATHLEKETGMQLHQCGQWAVARVRVSQRADGKAND